MEKPIITTFVLALLGIFVGFFLGMYLPGAGLAANVLVLIGFIFLVITLVLVIIGGIITAKEERSERRNW
jgi:hypothetical protein